MPKRLKIDKLIEELSQYDKRALDLGEKLYFKGIHLFDSHTHRLRKHVENREQAAVAAWICELLGERNGRKRLLNADERKNLERHRPQRKSVK